MSPGKNSCPRIIYDHYTPKCVFAFLLLANYLGTHRGASDFSFVAMLLHLGV